jgi:preprotein translocase SecE subunit
LDTTKSNQKVHNPNKVQSAPKPTHEKPTPSPMGSNLHEFIVFLQETWSEFRKISWPNRQQVIKETWTVLVLVAALTCAVLAFDWAIAKSIFEPLDKYAKHMGGGVGHTTQTWGPLAPRPGAPVDNPSIPGNQLPTVPVTPAKP